MQPSEPSDTMAVAPAGMRWIPRGGVTIGSDRHYLEERPALRDRVDGFWMVATAVTNADYDRFVATAPAGAEAAMLVPGGLHLTNTRQDPFPQRNGASDGFERTAPVASYPTNGFGLHDMAGNVWEWTTDWFAARHAADPAKPCCAPPNPRGPAMEASFDPGQPVIRIPRKLAKGGSFLGAPSYCRRHRPAARHTQMVDTGMSHIGSRCVLCDRSAPLGDDTP